MAFNFNGDDFLAIGAGLLSQNSLGKGFGKGFAAVGENRKGRRKEAFEKEKFDALKEHRARQFGLSVKQLDALEKYRGQTLGLREREMDAAAAQRATSNSLAQQRLNLTREQMNNPASIREFKAAKETGFEGSYVDFLTVKRSGTETFGKSPIYGKDAQGNTVLIQPGSQGSANIMQLPEGVTASSGIEKVDLGTHWGILDRRTGQMVGKEPKDIAGAASQKVQGTAHGEKVASAGATIDTADRLIADIDSMIKHPGRGAATGKTGLIPENVMAVTNPQAKDFIVRHRQAASGAFLQAFERLKGGGPITDVEGQKATDAIARMDRAQSEEAYLQSLNDFKSVVQGIKDRRQKVISTKPGAGGWTDLGNGVKIREKK